VGPMPGLDVGMAAHPSAIFVPLFYSDKDGKLLPGLATRYDTNKDATVYTFFLDKTAMWSDGKPIKAGDIVDWWNFIFHPARASWPASWLMSSVVGYEAFAAKKADTISGVKVVDDFTLQISLVAPESFFADRMGFKESAPARVDQYAHILKLDLQTAKEQWSAMQAVWLKEKAKDLIVSGPFRPVYLEPEPAAIYKFEPNPKWWGAKKPYLTGIEATTVRDMQTMSLMFEHREVDLLFELSGGAAVNLRKTMPTAFFDKPRYQGFTLWFNTTKPPMDDINLRKALLHAIPWEKMNEVAFEGQHLTIENGNPWPPSIPCYDASFAPYPFDVQKAKEYLAKSKYGPTGASVPRIVLLGGDQVRIRGSQIALESWRVNLGIANATTMQAEKEFTPEDKALRSAAHGAYGTNLPVPGLFLEILGHAKRSASLQNYVPGFENADLSKRIEKVLGMDMKSADYCPTVQGVLRDIMDQALMAPTVVIRSYYQRQPWVKGLEVGMWGPYNLDDTWLASR